MECFNTLIRNASGRASKLLASALARVPRMHLRGGNRKGLSNAMATTGVRKRPCSSTHMSTRSPRRPPSSDALPTQRSTNLQMLLNKVYIFLLNFYQISTKFLRHHYQISTNIIQNICPFFYDTSTILCCMLRQIINWMCQMNSHIRGSRFWKNKRPARINPSLCNGEVLRKAHPMTLHSFETDDSTPLGRHVERQS